MRIVSKTPLLILMNQKKKRFETALLIETNLPVNFQESVCFWWILNV